MKVGSNRRTGRRWPCGRHGGCCGASHWTRLLAHESISTFLVFGILKHICKSFSNNLFRSPGFYIILLVASLGADLPVASQVCDAMWVTNRDRLCEDWWKAVRKIPVNSSTWPVKTLCHVLSEYVEVLAHLTWLCLDCLLKFIPVWGGSVLWWASLVWARSPKAKCARTAAVRLGGTVYLHIRQKQPLSVSQFGPPWNRYGSRGGGACLTGEQKSRMGCFFLQTLPRLPSWVILFVWTVLNFLVRHFGSVRTELGLLSQVLESLAASTLIRTANFNMQDRQCYRVTDQKNI